MLLWATKAPKGSRDRYTFNYKEMKQINGDRQMKNVWRFSAPGNDEKRHGKHPTQKPVALIEQCLRASTSLGDRVFDPFAGSATTGVAAINLGRRFVGCEIDPKFARLGSKRLAAADTESKSATT
jgi:site-specific DNA-methyltransferase (adenine-specific)